MADREHPAVAVLGRSHAILPCPEGPPLGPPLHLQPGGPTPEPPPHPVIGVVADAREARPVSHEARLHARMRTAPGAANVYRQWSLDHPEIRLEVDELRAAAREIITASKDFQEFMRDMEGRWSPSPSIKSK